MATKQATRRLEDRIKHAIAELEALVAPAHPRDPSGRTVIAELVRRAELPSTIDGYPRSSGSEHVSGGNGADIDYSDPTGGAMLARSMDVCERCKGTGEFVRQDLSVAKCRRCDGAGKRWVDPIRDAVADITAGVGEVSRLCRRIDTTRARVVGVQAKEQGRQSSLQGNCLACGKAVSGVGEDRLKHGLDNACYLAWGSYKLKNPLEDGDPGAQFQRFLVWRRQRLEDQAKADREMDEVERLRSRGMLPARSRSSV